MEDLEEYNPYHIARRNNRKALPERVMQDSGPAHPPPPLDICLDNMKSVVVLPEGKTHISKKVATISGDALNFCGGMLMVVKTYDKLHKEQKVFGIARVPADPLPANDMFGDHRLPGDCYLDQLRGQGWVDGEQFLIDHISYDLYWAWVSTPYILPDYSQTINTDVIGPRAVRRRIIPSRFAHSMSQETQLTQEDMDTSADPTWWLRVIDIDGTDRLLDVPRLSDVPGVPSVGLYHDTEYTQYLDESRRMYVGGQQVAYDWTASMYEHYTELEILMMEVDYNNGEEGKNEIRTRSRRGDELSWTQELNGSRGLLNFEKLWKCPPNRDFVPCVEPSPTYSPPAESRGYLLVHTNGELNQMRARIDELVVVARIIYATLVIPELDKRSFWQDTSNFSDGFDEYYCINTLANDVEVIKKLPSELASTTKVVKHFRSWSGIDYYQDEIARMWGEYQISLIGTPKLRIIRTAKSDFRLANNNLPSDIQRLCCCALCEVLRFPPQIEAMGKLLVDRMRSYGPYIALHLRYEKDMLTFSGCTHGFPLSEAAELTTIRENTTYWKVKEINSRERRGKGYCPLSPKEVAMFITSLGYPSSMPIYITFEEIYGGDFTYGYTPIQLSVINGKGSN
ncbi:hypothetical protein GIB67_015530 [Kingdonia uniflora]|uniref:O-fucosyltransferase family protein n=1 Tax=Kingdonia uniflora TaxID=39325 RepID=A0A7J7LAE0_9MAGN|nr:hypothetical protein GIB67_015530 [Kingdonia uniflora]